MNIEYYKKKDEVKVSMVDYQNILCKDILKKLN